jgi:hypothetical protein
MVDPHSAERSIGRPGVCIDGGFLRLGRTLNKRSQHCGRCAENHDEASRTRCAASALDHDGDSGLARSAAAPPLAIPTDVGLVGLDIAFQKRSWEHRETRSKLV